MLTKPQLKMKKIKKNKNVIVYSLLCVVWMVGAESMMSSPASHGPVAPLLLLARVVLKALLPTNDDEVVEVAFPSLLSTAARLSANREHAWDAFLNRREGCDF